MTVPRSVTLWKSLGLRCLLVPRLEPESEAEAEISPPDADYFEVQLIRGRKILDVQVVSNVDAAYPIATQWQRENRSGQDSTSIAA